MYVGSNRINNVGTALEYFVKDMFCNSLNENSIDAKDKIYSKYLSYIGTQNNPPDFMITGGDAIEVKKIEGISSPVALNSSYPKAKLYADSDMILQACRKCEPWDVKDIIYTVGSVIGQNLKLLWMVYGDCYAASREVYEMVRHKMAKGVNELPGVEFSKTRELARVNRVDPLGITYLRIRGMWGIAHPGNVFSYVATYDLTKSFMFFALMRLEKYRSFPQEDREAIEYLNNPMVSISDVDIKNPDNPARFMPAKLIKFVIG